MEILGTVEEGMPTGSFNGMRSADFKEGRKDGRKEDRSDGREMFVWLRKKAVWVSSW